MMHRASLILSVLLISCLPGSVQAQSFDEFRASALGGYSNFRDSVMDEYNSFRRQINEDYARFLRGEWAEREAAPAPKRVPRRWVTPPVDITDPDTIPPQKDKPVPIDGVLPKLSIPDVQPQPIVPIKVVPPTPSNPDRYHEFSFYGFKTKVRLAPKQKFHLKSLKPNTIGNAWERVSEDDYNNLLADCLEARERMSLCDWAYLEYLRQLCESFFGEGTNEAVFMTAYLYCQSGYRIRFGLSGERLFLLVATPHQVYDKANYRLGDSNYVVFNGGVEAMSICDAPFKNERTMSLRMPVLPDLTGGYSEDRVIEGRFAPNVTATVCSDKGLIAFFDSYPSSHLDNDVCTRWAMYAETPMSQHTSEMLYPTLKSYIDGHSTYEAVNILCQWIQSGFVYGYDTDIWGDDRAFFAEETLYYPFCDCEDRSILLTRLVRDLLGLKCALIYYPGHLATAIAVGEDAMGDFVRIDGVKYLVCDPTYIGATIGKTMPGMNNASAKLILL